MKEWGSGGIQEADWAPHGEGGSRPMATSRLPGRARDWRQLLLVLLIVGGVVWLLYRAFGPERHIKVNPTNEQLANRFVQALLVRGDCAAAAHLASQRLNIPKTGSCWAYVDRELGTDYYRWRLVRGSGAVVPGCGFEGDLAARYGIRVAPEYSGYDDCVAYRLVTPLNGGYQGGYLVVWPRPRDGKWKVRRLDLDVAQCSGNCRPLWARRVPREQA